MGRLRVKELIKFAGLMKGKGYADLRLLRFEPLYSFTQLLSIGSFQDMPTRRRLLKLITLRLVEQSVQVGIKVIHLIAARGQRLPRDQQPHGFITQASFGPQLEQVFCRRATQDISRERVS